MAWRSCEMIVELVLVLGARYVSLRATYEAVPGVCETDHPFDVVGMVPNCGHTRDMGLYVVGVDT